MADSVAVLTGAIISSVVALAVVVLQQRLTQNEQTRAARAERLAQFTSYAWTVTLVVGAVARAELSDKDSHDGPQTYDTFDAYNEALNRLHLTEEDSVVRAATRLDTLIGDFHALARARSFSRDKWLQARVPMSEELFRFRAAARAALGRPALTMGTLAELRP